MPHPRKGPDDVVPFPALDGTAECNTFCVINHLMLIEKGIKTTSG